MSVFNRHLNRPAHRSSDRHFPFEHASFVSVRRSRSGFASGARLEKFVGCLDGVSDFFCQVPKYCVRIWTLDIDALVLKLISTYLQVIVNRTSIMTRGKVGNISSLCDFGLKDV